MSFETIWRTIQGELMSGTTVKNWTGDKGYLGDSFVVTAISSTKIEVETAKAKKDSKTGLRGCACTLGGLSRRNH